MKIVKTKVGKITPDNSEEGFVIIRFDAGFYYGSGFEVRTSSNEWPFVGLKVGDVITLELPEPPTS